ncbi:MAG: hypothetical protein NTU89_04360, partial [Candidatus Dependentiae bacterium]|nr:hypothetical protein [Candidatus Dependentiae bacterium]
MKYQARLNFLLGFATLTVSVFAQGSFAMPTDKTVLDAPQKPLRNNIFASVKNNAPASTPLDG